MAALPEYDSEYIQMDLFTFCSTAEEERVKFWRVRNSLQPSTVFHGVKTGVMGILQAGKAQAIKAAKGLAKKDEQPVFERFDNKWDFSGICKEVLEVLSSINKDYEKLLEEGKLQSINQQLHEKEVFISFHGMTNVGKSTILNAFLRNRYLPTDLKPDTAVTLHISDSSTHELQEDILMENYRLIARGLVPIREHLKKINENARLCDQRGVPKKYSLTLREPFEIKVPKGWKFTIVDSPGGNEHGHESIQTCVEESRANSSAYIFVLTLGNCQSTESCEALKSLYKHNEDIFKHARLTIVVNKMDLALFPSAGNKSRSRDEMKEEVRKYLYKFVFNCYIPDESVIVMSSEWALTARLYELSQICHETQDSQNRFTEESLQSIETDLEVLSVKFRRSQLHPFKESTLDSVAKYIEEQSCIKEFEKRLEQIADSSVNIWGKKISSDILQQLRILHEFLLNKRQSLCIFIKDFKENIQALVMMMKQMNKIYSEIIQACSDGGGRSKVWKLFEDACKEDLQNYKVRDICLSEAIAKLEVFKVETVEKIHSGQHQPDDFKKDLRQMSKNLSVTMDMCVHSMKHFKRTYQVCTKLNSEVSSQIMDMFKIAHEKLHNVPIPNKEESRREIFPNVRGPCTDILSDTNIPPGQPNWIDRILIVFDSLETRFHKNRDEARRSESCKRQNEESVTDAQSFCDKKVQPREKKSADAEFPQVEDVSLVHPLSSKGNGRLSDVGPEVLGVKSSAGPTELSDFDGEASSSSNSFTNRDHCEHGTEEHPKNSAIEIFLNGDIDRDSKHDGSTDSSRESKVNGQTVPVQTGSVDVHSIHAELPKMEDGSLFQSISPPSSNNTQAINEMKGRSDLETDQDNRELTDSCISESTIPHDSYSGSTEHDQPSSENSSQRQSHSRIQKRLKKMPYRRWCPELEQVFDDLKSKAKKDITEYFDGVDTTIIKVCHDHYRNMALNSLKEFDSSMKEIFNRQEKRLSSMIKELQAMEEKQQFCLSRIITLKVLSAGFQAVVDRIFP